MVSAELTSTTRRHVHVHSHPPPYPAHHHHQQVPVIVASAPTAPNIQPQQPPQQPPLGAGDALQLMVMNGMMMQQQQAQQLQAAQLHAAMRDQRGDSGGGCNRRDGGCRNEQTVKYKQKVINMGESFAQKEG